MLPIGAVSFKLETLDHYAQSLSLAGKETALSILSQAIASDLAYEGMDKAVLVLHSKPKPILGIVGNLNESEINRLRIQIESVDRLCQRLRYINYAQAETGCRILAAQLLEHYGREEMFKFKVLAIPRGGLIVLGMLTYILDLKQVQLEAPVSHDEILVVVDDCSLTGLRFSSFIAKYPHNPIIFATLFSPSDLRTAIRVEEPRVVACLSAYDLYDHGPDQLGDEYAEWKKNHRARFSGKRYWIGLPDHICFPWNEPDTNIWNPVAKRLEKGWRILPVEFCLKNQLPPGIQPLPIQVQPQGKGSLRPSDTIIFCEFQGRVVIGNVETGRTFGLSGVAADMWRALIEQESLEKALDVLLQQYEIDKITLKADFDAFIENLLERNLLVNQA